MSSASPAVRTSEQNMSTADSMNSKGGGAAAATPPPTLTAPIATSSTEPKNDVLATGHCCGKLRDHVIAVAAIKHNFIGLIEAHSGHLGHDFKLNIKPLFAGVDDTFLHVAAFYVRPHIVQLLLDKGAQHSMMNAVGMTPLWTLLMSFLARQRSQLPRSAKGLAPPVFDFVQAELELDITNDIMTVEDQNMWKGDWDDFVETFFKLMGAGADINYIPPNHDHVIKEAMNLGLDGRTMIDMLIYSKLIDPSKTNTLGETNLIAAAKSEYPKKASIIQRLIKGGNEVNARDNAGRTAAHHLANGLKRRETNDDIDSLRFLIACGTDFTIQDNQGKTALHYALERRANKFARILLETGSPADQIDNDGQSPLFIHLNDSEPQDEIEFASILYYILTYTMDLSVRDRKQQFPFWLRTPSNPYVLYQDLNECAGMANKLEHITIRKLRQRIDRKNLVESRRKLASENNVTEFRLTYWPTIALPLTQVLTNRTIQLMDEGAKLLMEMQTNSTKYIPKQKKGKKGKK